MDKDFVNDDDLSWQDTLLEKNQWEQEENLDLNYEEEREEEDLNFDDNS